MGVKAISQQPGLLLAQRQGSSVHRFEPSIARLPSTPSRGPHPVEPLLALPSPCWRPFAAPAPIAPPERHRGLAVAPSLANEGTTVRPRRGPGEVPVRRRGDNGAILERSAFSPAANCWRRAAQRGRSQFVWRTPAGLDREPLPVTSGSSCAITASLGARGPTATAPKTTLSGSVVTGPGAWSPRRRVGSRPARAR